MKKTRKPVLADSPRAAAPVTTGRDASAKQTHLSESARQDRDTRAYFKQVASDKDASLAFLKQAGILDSKGCLTKPFRG